MGSETELGTPEVSAGCSNTQCVIRFTGSPPGGESSLVGRSSEAPREEAAALGAHAWVAPAFVPHIPARTKLGLQHLLGVAGTRHQHSPKMALPNRVLATKATCSSPVDLPGSKYSREHKKIALLVPESPTGPSASHFSQLWDTAQRERGWLGKGCASQRRSRTFWGVQGCSWGPKTPF